MNPDKLPDPLPWWIAGPDDEGVDVGPVWFVILNFAFGVVVGLLVAFVL